MAKSIRSKSKLGSRNVKRYNPKSDYAVVQAARLHQTASRLAAKNKHGRTVAEEEADEVEGIEGDEKMLEEEQEGGGQPGDAAESKGWYRKQLSPSKDVYSDAGEQDVQLFDDVSYALLGLCDPSELSTSMFEESDAPCDSESDAGLAIQQSATASLEKLGWLLEGDDQAQT